MFLLRRTQLYGLLLLGCAWSSHSQTALAMFTSHQSAVASRASFSPSPATDAIIYNLGRTATPATGRCAGGKPCPLVTVNRTLTERLGDRISVLDFGADGGCRGDTEPGCKVDSTAAFTNALMYAGGEDSSPETWQTVYVPPGYYRIDGTITVGGQWLIIQKGARLLRKRFATDNAAPILRVVGTHGRVTGGGVLMTENVSPRGVLNIGPENLTAYDNIGMNTIEGVSIVGSSLPECTNRSSGPVVCTGVHMDSSEPFVGGSCYQNNVRDLEISGVDAGVYAGKYVNANQLSGIQMGSIGRYGYLFVNNTENSVFGGFMTGGGLPNIPRKVIAGRGSGYNWFVSVQAEPGGLTSYFDFDNRSEANAVIGHDNCPHGGSSQDPAFLYQEGRSFHMGNFNQSGSGASLGAEHCTSIEGKAASCLMQIEGSAFIKNLTTVGLRCATGSTDICAVEDEIAELRGTVASQEAQIAEQGARIDNLERALAILLQDKDDEADRH